MMHRKVHSSVRKEDFLDRSEANSPQPARPEQIREKIADTIKSLGGRARNLWNLLPPRDDQPLLKYVVFRLEGSDNFSLSAARRRSLFYIAVIFISVAAISLTMLLIKAFFIPSDIYWINSELHTLLETFCGLISIIIGMILAWEYSISGKKNVLFLVYSFFSFGILSFFHAFSNYCHNLFVWFHSSGALFGSLFFFMSMFVHRSDESYTDQLKWLRRFSIFFVTFLILVFAVLSNTYYSHIPDVLSVPFQHHTDVSMAKGPFSTFIYGVNHISGLLYVLAGILFVKGFLKSNDIIYLIFGTSAFLFFTSEIFFGFSNLWNPMWWYWHFIKAFIFSVLLLGLAYGFTKTFYRLYTSRIQLAKLLNNIEGKNIEIEKAYMTLKETQRYLSESEKLASIGKMAAMMAHEIRNPLGAITNSVGVLKKYSLRPEETTEILSLVEDEMERLNKLTEDFLSFAKPSHLRRNKTNINTVLAETLAFLNTEGTKSSGIIFHESFDPDIPLLMLDKNHIKQVFINIMMNSIQAISQDGVITIRTRYKKTEDEVEITFADTGIGMAEDELSQVFQPFYTTKDKGMGLGLNIIHKIVKEHGGYILLSSKKGEGTEINLNFPVSRKIVPPDTLNTSVYPDTILIND
jgi:signal transduction histidine kinase